MQVRCVSPCWFDSRPRSHCCIMKCGFNEYWHSSWFQEFHWNSEMCSTHVGVPVDVQHSSSTVPGIPLEFHPVLYTCIRLPAELHPLLCRYAENLTILGLHMIIRWPGDH